MKIYQFLSGIRLLKNYAAKFMFIAFLGVHLPLFGIIGLLIFSSGSNISKVSFLLLTIGFTLLATVVTLFVLKALIAPLQKAQASLNQYLETQTLPNLPNHFEDEPGLLMRDINIVVQNLHTNIAQRDAMIKALSHDLRAPATNIAALINLAKDEPDAAEVANYLSKMQNVINKQLQLMDAMAHNYEY